MTTLSSIKHFSFFKKLTALAVCISMVLGSVPAYAAPANSSNTLTIPSDFGKADEFSKAQSGKTIIYIQDAHDSLEAQENIARLIEYFVEKEGVKTVFEEGYEGPVPTDKYFGFIKDPALKQKTSWFLLDKLRLGGAEYAHINRKKDFKLIGADSIRLHLKNIKSYRQTAAKKVQTDADIAALSQEIEKLANQYFPKELKEWMKLKVRFETQKLDLLEYVKRTCMLRKNSKEAAAAYPALHFLLTAGSIKDKRAEVKLKSLEASAVFQEINRLENDFSAERLENERNRRIFQYYKYLHLVRRLSGLEITPPEYEAVRNQLQDLKTQAIAEFIVKQTGKSLILSKRWEENIQEAINFYRISQERDLAIEKRLEEFKNQRDEKTAVLVFGGFHKERIKDILQKQGFSYFVLSPKITEINTKHGDYYKQLMSKGHFSFEAPFHLARAARAASFLYQTLTQHGRVLANAELRVIADTITKAGLKAENSPAPILDKKIQAALSSFRSAPPIRSELREIQDQTILIQDKKEQSRRLKIAPLSKEYWIKFRKEIFELLKRIPADVAPDIAKQIDERVNNLNKYDPDLSFIVFDEDTGLPVGYTVSRAGENQTLEWEKLAIAEEFSGTVLTSWIVYHSFQNAKDRSFEKARWNTTQTNARSNPYFLKIGATPGELTPPREDAGIPGIFHQDYSGQLQDLIAGTIADFKRKQSDGSGSARSEVRADIPDLAFELAGIPELHLRLKHVRELFGLSKAAAARKFSASASKISNYESLKPETRKLPAKTYVEKLAELAGINPVFIWKKNLPSVLQQIKEPHIRLKYVRLHLRETEESIGARLKMTNLTAARVMRSEMTEGRDQQTATDTYTEKLAKEAAIDPQLLQGRSELRKDPAVLIAELKLIPELHVRLKHVRDAFEKNRTKFAARTGIPVNERMIKQYETTDGSLRKPPAEAYVKVLAELAGIDTAWIWWGKPLENALQEAPELSEKVKRAREYLGESQLTLAKRSEISVSNSTISRYEAGATSGRLFEKYAKGLAQLAGISPALLFSRSEVRKKIDPLVQKKLDQQTSAFQARFMEIRKILAGNTAKPGEDPTEETIVSFKGKRFTRHIPLALDLIAYELARYHFVPKKGDRIRFGFNRDRDPHEAAMRQKAMHKITIVFGTGVFLETKDEIQRAFVAEIAHTVDALIHNTFGYGRYYFKKGSFKTPVPESMFVNLVETQETLRSLHHGLTRIDSTQSLLKLFFATETHDRSEEASRILFDMTHEMKAAGIPLELAFSLTAAFANLAMTAPVAESTTSIDSDFANLRTALETLKKAMIESPSVDTARKEAKEALAAYRKKVEEFSKNFITSTLVFVPRDESVEPADPASTLLYYYDAAVRKAGDILEGKFPSDTLSIQRKFTDLYIALSPYSLENKFAHTVLNEQIACLQYDPANGVIDSLEKKILRLRTEAPFQDPRAEKILDGLTADIAEARSFLSPASPRSEVRLAETARVSPAEFDKTIHLKTDVIFTIRPETIEKLARGKKTGEHDQWLELLGLKMLNEDKLHIVIDSKENGQLGARSMELRMAHKNVHLGWGRSTMASLPKKAPVIEFEKLINGTVPAELLKERTSRQIDATFDIFDGAFMAALRYAQDPGRLERLAHENKKTVTSAAALDMGLLEQFIKSYAIISQSA